MKRLKNYIFILLISFISICPCIVKADSGLDASYGDSSEGGIVSAITSGASPVFELLQAHPGDEDYDTCHIIISIICIVLFCIITNIFIFKLNDKRNKWLLFGINCIPTIAFALLCFLTKMELSIYFIPTVLYSIIFYIITSIILKIRFKKNMKLVLSKDKKYNEEEIGKDIFNIYKDIQIAWMNFNIDSVKDNLSEKIYNEYIKQLEKLKNDNQKNMMENIEYISNKIVNISIDNNIETITSELTVTCNDYIINDNEEVIKGKKDKKNEYKYKLVFDRNIDTNKYVLIEKKITKQK